MKFHSDQNDILISKRLWGDKVQYIIFTCLIFVLSGCATRPVNPRIDRVEQNTTYRVERKVQDDTQKKTLFVLAFSGGGTRAAAFSYGVLEALNRTKAVRPDGKTGRLIDQIDIITGVSGGSFTALAYKLYGDRLFEEYEKRFLKRNVQGELIWRALNLMNWGSLLSTGWGRSEMAADLYDEILFNGATFADLEKTDGPFVAVSATDITSGSRIVFSKPVFDAFCTDIGTFKISRAAAASSAVPVVLSPLTINNYGGSCDYQLPEWAQWIITQPSLTRSAARVKQRLLEVTQIANGNYPYLHLVDGGVSDNISLRGVLDSIHLMEALNEAGFQNPLNHVEKIVVISVNALSVYSTDWAQKENGPSTLSVLVKAAGVPIDRYSGEQIDQLKDMEARWKMMRQFRDAASQSKSLKASMELARSNVMSIPNAEIYLIDISFSALKDKEERDYLNQLPTSFVLPAESVDRLRTAAGNILFDSPDFQRLIKDLGAEFNAQLTPTY